MQPTTNTTKKFASIRTLTHAAMIAVFLAAPFAAQAGPIDRVKTRVDQTHAQVKAIRGRVNAIYGDLQEKRQMLGAEGKEQLMEAIQTTIEYMQHARADYGGFTAPDNCGPASECGAFRKQLKDMIQGFIALPTDLPFVETVPASVGQLQKMASLLDHMPPPVLYATSKSIGAPLANVQNLLDTVRAVAEAMPEIPTIREINEMNVEAAKLHCSVVLDNPHIALLRVAFQNLAGNLTDIAGLLPDTLDVVAATFGTNIKMPPKLIMQVIALIPTQIDRKLNLRQAALKSRCAILGVTK